MARITFFAKTNFRGQEKLFGIKREDRRYHIYIIGKTGMGKSTLLLNMILSDIFSGEGVGLIDPHGDLAEMILDYIPDSRIEDTIYFNPSDREYPIPLNILHEKDPSRRHLLVSAIISIFKRMWRDFWGPRLEHLLRNTVLALLDYPDHPTLLDVCRMLSDPNFRERVIREVKDPLVKAFWRREFSGYHIRLRSEALAPIQNKIGQFLTTPLVRNIVAQKKAIDLREAMDEGKILICNLSKGRIGEENSSFLGSLVAMKLQLSSMERVDLPEERRRDFFLYVDEFQNFISADVFPDVLSEARKYRLCLTIAHQYISQLDRSLIEAIFGNVGTIISFRVGVEDAEFLERIFYPPFSREDLVNLDRYGIYLRMAINGKSSPPFSAKTLPPFYGFEHQGNRERVISASRERYAARREEIEREVERQMRGF